jgi:hypothetical protein
MINDVERQIDEAGNIQYNFTSYDIRDKLKIPKLEDFASRKEFNEWKYETEKFNKGVSAHSKIVKNKHGVNATEYLLTVAENTVKRANENAEKERKKLKDKPFISRGKVVDTALERQALLRRPQALGFSKTEFDFGNQHTFLDFSRNFTNLIRKGDADYYNWRKETMKENFIELLVRAFHSDSNELVYRLSQITPDEFYEMYLMFDELDFDLYYNLDGEASGEIKQLLQIEHYVEMYEEGKLNFDLKGF